jgi:predicted oxidoreductase
MKRIKLGGVLEASAIALGCMRIDALSPAEAERLVKTALENGVDFFDHADIYGGGRSEEVFAQAAGMCPSVREKMVLQTKCGIRDGMYDFSREHILRAVEGSLRRLKTDYVDVLLLHRPDTLVEPEELAGTFRMLRESGKVRHFGVSNQTPMMMELLAKYLDEPIIANQLQFGIMHTGMVDQGLNANMKNDPGVDRDGGVLEYCRLKDITIQPWSPFQFGFFEGVFIGNDRFPEVNCALDELAEKYGVTKNAAAIAWILRHPARMQPIVGTTNAGRLAEICRACEVELTREEWYAVYRAAGNRLP